MVKEANSDDKINRRKSSKGKSGKSKNNKKIAESLNYPIARESRTISEPIPDININNYNIPRTVSEPLPTSSFLEANTRFVPNPIIEPRTVIESTLPNPANPPNNLHPNNLPESRPEPQPDAVNNKGNGWNQAIDDMLLELEDKSWGYTWMHKKSVNYFSKFHDRLSITNIIFSLISGTSTFATLNTISGVIYIQVGTGTVIYAAALLAAIQHFKAYAERIEQHKQAASKYSSLYHSIKRERTLRLDERTGARDYITWVTNQYDSYLLNCPDIEDDIMDQYIRQYKTVGNNSGPSNPSNNTFNNQNTFNNVSSVSHVLSNYNTRRIPTDINMNIIMDYTDSHDNYIEEVESDAVETDEARAETEADDPDIPREPLKKSLKNYRNDKDEVKTLKIVPDIKGTKDKRRHRRRSEEPSEKKGKLEKQDKKLPDFQKKLKTTQVSSVRVPKKRTMLTNTNTNTNTNPNTNPILTNPNPTNLIKEPINNEKISERTIRERTKFDLRTPGLRCGYSLNPETKGQSSKMSNEDLEMLKQRHIANRNNYDQNIFQYEMERLNNM